MKAFILDRYGSKTDLRPGDMPYPELREDDVLVQVHAAGLNLLDSKIRKGEFKLILPYRPPLILGHDVAGVVVQVGSRVRRFKAGDEVYARPDDGRIGAFAEFISIREDSVAHKPTNLTMEEAASIPRRHSPALDRGSLSDADLRRGARHAGRPCRGRTTRRDQSRRVRRTDLDGHGDAAPGRSRERIRCGRVEPHGPS